MDITYVEETGTMSFRGQALHLPSVGEMIDVMGAKWDVARRDLRFGEWSVLLRLLHYTDASTAIRAVRHNPRRTHLLVTKQIAATVVAGLGDDWTESQGPNELLRTVSSLRAQKRRL